MSKNRNFLIYNFLQSAHFLPMPTYLTRYVPTCDLLYIAQVWTAMWVKSPNTYLIGFIHGLTMAPKSRFLVLVLLSYCLLTIFFHLFLFSLFLAGLQVQHIAIVFHWSFLERLLFYCCLFHCFPCCFDSVE